MINLIPPGGHAVMRREYLLRVSATVSFLFTGVFVFLTIALIPTYVLVEAQINTFALDERDNSKEDALKNAEAEVSRVKAILTQLKSTPDTITASDVIDEVRKSASPNIFFKTFDVNASAGIIESIHVQGIAPTRETLAGLKRALEESKIFLRAEVPISDLARDADLPFAITITLEK